MVLRQRGLERRYYEEHARMPVHGRSKYLEDRIARLGGHSFGSMTGRLRALRVSALSVGFVREFLS
jgi:hypothetical protein